jgi:hypothetical protein
MSLSLTASILLCWGWGAVCVHVCVCVRQRCAHACLSASVQVCLERAVHVTALAYDFSHSVASGVLPHVQTSSVTSTCDLWCCCTSCFQAVSSVAHPIRLSTEPFLIPHLTFDSSTA